MKLLESILTSFSIDLGGLPNCRGQSFAQLWAIMAPTSNGIAASPQRGSCSIWNNNTIPATPAAAVKTFNSVLLCRCQYVGCGR